MWCVYEWNKIEDEMLVKLEEMVNLQIKWNKNLEINENNLRKIFAQRTFWRGNSRNALCWAFYCVNDNK
jgi:hypothetical protein